MPTVENHQAFPAFNSHGECLVSTDGLTKREYFAAKVCAALCANPNFSSLSADPQVAAVAKEQADLLIAALND